MKEDQIPVKEIVRQYLVRHGYDGLCADGYECGCDLKRLMHCAFNPRNCRPGYKTGDPSGQFLYLIGSEKEKQCLIQS